jgi:hypothetical protein
MKQINFDWMFTGCHPFFAVAVSYFPSAYSCSSSRSLRRYIRSHPALLADMLAVEYDEHDSILTPAQIAVLIRHLGVPSEASLG